MSAAIAAVFSAHGQGLRRAERPGGKAFHAQVRAVAPSNGAGSSYALAEAVNASPLQAVVQGAQSPAVFSPVKDLTGRPPFGNGANGAPGIGQNGASGGWLWPASAGPAGPPARPAPGRPAVMAGLRAAGLSAAIGGAGWKLSDRQRRGRHGNGGNSSDPFDGYGGGGGAGGSEHGAGRGWRGRMDTALWGPVVQRMRHGPAA